MKKKGLFTILFLMSLAALGEYLPAASRGTEARSASFRARQWRWWGPSDLPRLQLRELPRCSLYAEPSRPQSQQRKGVRSPWSLVSALTAAGRGNGV